jgi:hypothetical protein
MELPRRIVDGGAGEWERQVLLSAEADAPTQLFRRRLANRLGALAAAAVTSAGAGPAKLLGAGVLVKWLGMGVIAGVVGGSAVYAVRSTGSGRPTGSPAVSTRSAAPVVASSPAVATPHVEVQPPVTPPLDAAKAPKEALASSFVESSGPVPDATASAPRASTRLADEMAVIHEVRATLAAREPARASSQLDDYARAFPAGLLRVEAEVLRIEALFALGNRAEADRRARRFVSDHAGSPYVRRVRSMLEGTAGAAR